MADIQVDLGHGRNAGGQRQSRCNSLDPPCCRTCSVLTKNAGFTTKSTFSRGCRATPQAPGLGSLLKYPAPPREIGLGWVARHERRACPSRGGGMRNEQRSQTIQGAITLRVASLFRLSGGYSSIADRCAYAHSLAPWKDEKSAATRHGWVFSTGSQAATKVQGPTQRS